MELFILLVGIIIGLIISPDFKQVRCPMCAALLAVKKIGDYENFICTECDFAGNGRKI